MATTPIGEYYRKAYQNFSGGLNTLQNPLVIKESEFTQLDNAQINQTGLLETGPGYVLDSSPFPATADSWIRMLSVFKRGVTVNNMVSAASDAGNTNATFKVDVKQTSGNGVWSYIGYTTGTATFAASTAVVGSGTSWLTQIKAGDKIKNTQDADTLYVEVSSVNSDTSITLTGNYAGTTGAGKSYNARVILNNTQIPQSVPFNNLLIISNGSDAMYSWDNSTTNLLTQAPKGRFLCAYRNRVFTANTSGGPSTLYWSYAFDQTTWDATSLSQIFPQDNGNIVNITSFANSIIVFKDNGKVYQVLGNFGQTAIGQPDYISQIDVPDNIGVIGGYSVVQNDAGQLVFLAQTGIYTMDQGLNFQKISWDINNDVLNTVLTSGLSVNKSFPYTSVTQFGTGTYTGTVTRSNYGLQPYCDYTSRQTDITSNSGTTGTVFSIPDRIYGTCIATDNTQHVFTAERTSGNLTHPHLLNHRTLSTDGTSSTERVPIDVASLTYYITITGLSVAIASNGTIGIAFSFLNENGKNYLGYIEKVGGVWGALTLVKSGTNTALRENYQSPSLVFSNTDPRIAWQDNEGNHFIYSKRVGGVWTNTNISGISCSNNSQSIHIEMVLNASLNPRVIWGPDKTTGTTAFASDGTVRAYKSNDDGGSWTAYTALTAITYSRGCTIDESGNFLSLFVSTAGGINVLNKRNWDSSTTSTQESTASTTSLIPIGYIRQNNTDYVYEWLIDSAGIVYEKFVITYPAWVTSTGYVVGNAVTNSGNTYYCLVAHTSGTFATDLANHKWILLGVTSASVQGSASVTSVDSNPCSTSVFSVNGNVFVSASPDASLGPVIFRRVSFLSNWIGVKNSDSTLSLWQSFTVSGEVDAGNTVIFQVGLGSTSTLSAPVTIINGQQVSSDATQIFNQPWAIFWLNTLMAPTVSSIILPYIGTGAGAAFPTAYIFNNEMYTSVAQNGATQNAKILFLDKGNAWSNRPYPVLFMCRYNYSLYGGSSLKGDVFHLSTGYTSNGSAFTVTAVSKEDLLGSLELQKEVSKLYVIYQIQNSGTFTFSYRPDNFTTLGGSTWNDTTVDMTKDGIAEIPVTTGALRSIQVKIAQTTAGSSLGIVGWVILYGYLNVR